MNLSIMELSLIKDSLKYMIKSPDEDILTKDAAEELLKKVQTVLVGKGIDEL